MMFGATEPILDPYSQPVDRMGGSPYLRWQHSGMCISVYIILCKADPRAIAHLRAFMLTCTYQNAHTHNHLPLLVANLHLSATLHGDMQSRPSISIYIIISGSKSAQLPAQFTLSSLARCFCLWGGGGGGGGEEGGSIMRLSLHGRAGFLHAAPYHLVLPPAQVRPVLCSLHMRVTLRPYQPASCSSATAAWTRRCSTHTGSVG